MPFKISSKCSLKFPKDVEGTYCLQGIKSHQKLLRVRKRCFSQAQYIDYLSLTQLFDTLPQWCMLTRLSETSWFFLAAAETFLSLVQLSPIHRGRIRLLPVTGFEFVSMQENSITKEVLNLQKEKMPVKVSILRYCYSYVKQFYKK